MGKSTYIGRASDLLPWLLLWSLLRRLLLLLLLLLWRRRLLLLWRLQVHLLNDNLIITSIDMKRDLLHWIVVGSMVSSNGTVALPDALDKFIRHHVGK